MHRFWAVFAAGLVTCVLPGPAWAEEQAPTQLWLRAAVPPQPNGKSPGILLKRGDAVTPVGKIDCELGGFTAIRFGPENQHQARVPTWLLSTTELSATKPRPQPDAPAAAKAPSGDFERLKGSWGVVAQSMLGTLNPALKDKLNARPAAEYWLRREMRGRGLDGDKFTIRGFDATVAGALQMSGFAFDGCVFVDKLAAFWRMSAADCAQPLEQTQNYAGTYEFHLDATTTPKQIDLLQRIHATRDVLAIYEFDGEFLKIAMAPSWVQSRSNRPLDSDHAHWLRPAGFDAESAQQAMVYWLSRLDEREFPAPPGSLSDTPPLLTAPGVETSERLSEPLKKLLGTWREVVHEESGNRDRGSVWFTASR